MRTVSDSDFDRMYSLLEREASSGKINEKYILDWLTGRGQRKTYGMKRLARALYTALYMNGVVKEKQTTMDDFVRKIRRRYGIRQGVVGLEKVRKAFERMKSVVTKEELEVYKPFVIEYYMKYGFTRTVEKFKELSKSQIARLIYGSVPKKKLVSKRWTKEDIEMLKRHDGSIYELAKRLGRSVKAVREKARKLGIRKATKRMRWSRDEVRILRELYPVSSAKHIAGIIGRSVSAVYKKASKLGIRKREKGGKE